MMIEGVAGDERSTDVDADLTREEVKLMRKVELLEAFLDQNKDALPPVQERCRVLHQRIEVMEAALSRAERRDEARDFVESFLLSHRDQTGYAMALSSSSPRGHFGALQAPNIQQSTGEGEMDRNITRSLPTEELSELGSISHRPKRARTGAKDIIPCLRCRVLKKRCDSLDQCSHCPQRNDENESDYWKVLGCHRGPLKSLSEIFCPAYARSTTRTLRRHGKEFETVYLTPKRLLPFLHSETRIAHLIETNDNFRNLRASVWDDVSVLSHLPGASSRTTTSVWSSYTLDDFKAPWYLLQVLAQKPIYLTRKAEYNVLTLIRIGNMLSNNGQSPSHLLIRAKNLLLKATEIYISEVELVDYSSPQPGLRTYPFSTSPGALVEVKSDLEEFLEGFESTCSGRGKLSGLSQLTCFFALLLFSVVKTLLIDAYSLKVEYEEPSSWNAADAVRIASAYKAMVSVFGWASKSDILTGSDTETGNPHLQLAIQETRQMLHQSKWDERGIKGSKDFLLGLGSCVFPNQVYNGFWVQNFGFAELVQQSSAIGGGRIKLPDKARTLGISTHPSDGSDQQGNFSWETMAAPLLDWSLPIGPELNYDGPWSSWNSTNLRVPRYLPGYVAFGLTPEPSLGSTKPTSGTYSTFQLDPNTDKNGARSSRRSGKLGKDQKAKAAAIRKLKACWACWLLKVPCSEGETCERCIRFNPGSNMEFSNMECSRLRFNDYEKTIFPELLYSQFHRASVETYMDTYSSGFVDDDFEIGITWDGLCPTKLSVRVSIPKTLELLRPVPRAVNNSLQLEPSVPVGIMMLSKPDIKNLLRIFLETALADKQLPSLIPVGHSRKFGQRTLDIVLRFYRDMDNALLWKVLLLYLATHCLLHPITFSDSSALLLRQKFEGVYSLSRSFTSRLLDLQIKCILTKIGREQAGEVLESLEKAFRSRTTDAWSPSLCGTLVLCMCVEELQIAAIASIGVQAVAGNQPSSRDAAVEACKALEEGPMKWIPNLFHEIFKTRQIPNEAGRAGFNPFRAYFADKELGADRKSDLMVREFGQMITELYPEMQELNQLPDFEAEAEQFERKNRGRLISKFLLSFLDEEALEEAVSTSKPVTTE